jgi:hypothetical protein
MQIRPAIAAAAAEYARCVDVGVLVAGAGPVGLTLACELERQGVEHRSLDAAPERAVVSRATDLHARSLELWDHTGVAEAILEAGLAITGVPLFSGGREVARLDFGGVDSPFPAATSLRQRDLEALLAQRLTTRGVLGDAAAGRRAAPVLPRRRRRRPGPGGWTGRDRPSRCPGARASSRQTTGPASRSTTAWPSGFARDACCWRATPRMR